VHILYPKSLMDTICRQNNVVKKKNLSHWEKEFGGTTAEAIARRVINKFDPIFEEPDRSVNKQCQNVAVSSVSGQDQSEGPGSRPTSANAAALSANPAPTQRPHPTGLLKHAGIILQSVSRSRDLRFL
jgi:hypothetical protein